MKTIEVGPKSNYIGKPCAQCSNVVKAGQWIILLQDQSTSPSRSYATHAKCMRKLVAKAGLDKDDREVAEKLEWERRRALIIEKGTINVG